MNYLKSFVAPSAENGVANGQEENEAVDRLIERYETSSMASDRRDCVKALKALSRDCRGLVGTRALHVFLDALHSSDDHDTRAYALATLVTICSVDDDRPVEQDDDNDLAQQFAEMLASKAANVDAVLGCVGEYERDVRLPAVRLLTELLRQSPRPTQDAVLACPGVPVVMDLLNDRREVIRNEAILLLVSLAHDNVNVQKAIAFEDGFERLLRVVDDEDTASVVAEDAFIVIMHLLNGNDSNQQFFRENSLIRRLVPLVELYFQVGRSQPGDEDDSPHADLSDDEWSQQKIANVTLLFGIIRVLVSPSNPLTTQTNPCQNYMRKCGLLAQMCECLLTTGCPAVILTEAIAVVAEMIRGNIDNQTHFSSVRAPNDPSRSVITMLLSSMTNPRQPFSLRCAVLYCFHCSLYGNDEAKAGLVHTLLPSDVTADGGGHLLVSGLLSSDSTTAWLSASALSHLLVGQANPLKEQMLQVHLATSSSSSPSTLLTQCLSVLSHSARPQTRLAVLLLLAQWLAHCPRAIREFLGNKTAIPALTGEACSNEGGTIERAVHGVAAFVIGLCVIGNDNTVEEFTAAALTRLIEQRIKTENFVKKINNLERLEAYSRAMHSPQLLAKTGEELVFDHEFALLFKSMEQQVLRIVTTKSNAQNGYESAGDLNGYKDLIKQQDTELTRLREENGRLRVERDSHIRQEHVLQAEQINMALREQQEGISQLSMAAPQPDQQLQAEVESLRTEVERLKAQLAAKQTESQAAESYKQTIECLNESLRQSREDALRYYQNTEAMRQWFTTQTGADPNAALQAQLTEVEQQLQYGWTAYEEQTNLLGTKADELAAISAQVSQQSEQLISLQAQMEQQMQKTQLSQSQQQDAQLHAAQAELQAAQSELLALRTEREQYGALQQENYALRQHCDTLGQQIGQLSQQLSLQQQQHQQMNGLQTSPVDQAEYQALKHEQDELLTLLSDQDRRLRDYRGRLRDAGHEVTDSDESDEDDSR